MTMSGNLKFALKCSFFDRLMQLFKMMSIKFKNEISTRKEGLISSCPRYHGPVAT